MKCTGFRIVLLIAGLLAIIFQVVGLCVMAWYRMEIKSDLDSEPLHIKMDLGLWKISMCVTRGVGEEEVCLSSTKEDILKFNQSVDNKQMQELGQMLLLKVMVVLAAVLSGIGLLLTVLYMRQLDAENQSKCSGVCGAICWILGALILGGALAIHIYHYITNVNSIEMVRKMGLIQEIVMQLHFPWAVYFTGAGAFFAILTGLLLSIRMCKSSRQPYEGYTAQYKA